METLERMPKRRPVVLAKYFLPDLNSIAGVNGQDLRVECPVMDRTHGHAVRHDRVTALSVLLDVSGIEQLRVLEPAKGASRSICNKDAATEDPLVKACMDRHLRIPPNGIEPGSVG